MMPHGVGLMKFGAATRKANLMLIEDNPEVDIIYISPV